MADTLAAAPPALAGADARAARLAGEAVARFGLDLSGLTVFTEAAGGHFRWTAILALLAGAERVDAIARDSRWASADEAGRAVTMLAEELGIADRLRIVRDHATVGEADVVTNLGFVRPIDAALAARMKPTAVVPLMWETWEYRPSDLDLAACERHGILVLGTDEHDPELRIFGYVGMLGLQLLLDAGVEVFRSRILVAGGGAFGEAALDTLAAAGAEVRVVCAAGDLPGTAGDVWLGETLDAPGVIEFLRHADALLFMEHHAEEMLVGPGAGIDAAALAALNPGLRITHVSGRIDADGLRAAGLEVVPAAISAAARTMSVTTAHLGPRPLIDLHAAGLRVGQAMAEARRASASLAEARERALRHPLCQDFAPAQLAPLGITRA